MPAEPTIEFSQNVTDYGAFNAAAGREVGEMPHQSTGHFTQIPVTVSVLLFAKFVNGKV